MPQTQIISSRVGALTEDTRTDLNNNFNELYAGTAPVVITAATTLVPGTHARRPLVINNAAGFTVTLPAATGSGNKYEFYIKTTITSSAFVIQANTTLPDTIQGKAYLLVTTTQTAFSGDADSDYISLNGGTTGGFAGDIIEMTDVATGIWAAKLFLTNSSSGATPFADT